ncbi:PIN domain-containing protein [Mesorhizobium sp. W067]
MGDFLLEAAIEVVPIERGDAKLAIQAFSNYGKGRGHPAQLNLADCLSYASAKSRGMPSLYRGKGFSHTDLA